MKKRSWEEANILSCLIDNFPELQENKNKRQVKSSMKLWGFIVKICFNQMILWVIIIETSTSATSTISATSSISFFSVNLRHSDFVVQGKKLPNNCHCRPVSVKQQIQMNYWHIDIAETSVTSLAQFKCFRQSDFIVREENIINDKIADLATLNRSWLNKAIALLAENPFILNMSICSQRKNSPSIGAAEDDISKTSCFVIHRESRVGRLYVVRREKMISYESNYCGSFSLLHAKTILLLTEKDRSYGTSDLAFFFKKKENDQMCSWSSFREKTRRYGTSDVAFFSFWKRIMIRCVLEARSEERSQLWKTKHCICISR